MSFPFFYQANIHFDATSLVIDEDTSKHIVQVLRMQNGERLYLTDGKGNIKTCVITDNNRKRCTVEIEESEIISSTDRKVTIAISLLKNNTRIEWFLEKATEIGVSEICPIICERTEKISFKNERLQSIITSAMLQSQQAWMPVLQAPQQLNRLINSAAHQYKFIAHCTYNETTKDLSKVDFPEKGSCLVLIGPEGDFTKDEVDNAIERGFAPVSLGQNRLRTETAGIVAATLMCQL